MGKKRKSATEVVKGAVRANWLDSLSHGDREYVQEVLEVMRDTPQVSVYAVAAQLKEELDIQVARDNIAKKLKELI
jgi:hypothetical protein